MASSGKKKTTMAKLSRESRLRERRMEKKARKEARKLAASQPDQAGETLADDEFNGETGDGLSTDEADGNAGDEPTADERELLSPRAAITGQ
jgi:hypothetical protein